ncbi:MAG: YitT family protein [Brevibacillus sp.]|nr:YitT family protein [Brevibacillus sp.]
MEGAVTSTSRRKAKKRRIVTRALIIFIGAILVSVGLEIFLVPNNIIDGGVTGLSIMLSHLTGLKLGLFLFVLNLPFLIIGLKQIGKTFAISTLFGVAVMSAGTSLLLPVPSLTHDLLLSAVFGGIIVGIGVGLVIRAGGSLDGTEIVAILLTKKSPFSVGEVVMFFNIFILGSAGFIFGWDRAMYSLIAYYIAYKMIDLTMVGLDQSRSVYIISDNPDEIGDALAARLGRGITYLSGEGGFSGENKKVIFCVITRLEEAQLKSIVEEIDPSAFLAIGHIHDVSGGRFKKKNIH